MSAADTALASFPVVPADEWVPRQEAHVRRIDEMVGDHVARRRRGETHPVVDFLFTYYSLRPAHLRRWSPGYGTALSGRSADRFDGRTGWTVTHERDRTIAAVSADYLDRRSQAVRHVVDLVTATARRPALTGCFGLHEWAMVYRAEPSAIRHSAPLRLGRTGTDAVVESSSIRCTHYDAFRFFTPHAVSLNAEALDPQSRLDREQPGCLHANMDLYKWASKLGPLVPAELTADCFAMASTAREIDMRASPYDLSRYGYDPIAIETPHGRAEYVRHQTALARTASELRDRLITECRVLLTDG